jgi:cell division protease FtsH
MKLLFSFINISLYGIHGLLFSQRYELNMNNYKKYPLSRPFHNKYLNRISLNNSNSYLERKNELLENFMQKRENKYPLSVNYYEKFVKRLNARNIGKQMNNITNQMDEVMNDLIGNLTEFENVNKDINNERKNRMKNKIKKHNMRIIVNGPSSNEIFNQLFGDQLNKDDDYDDDYNELEDDFYEKAKKNPSFGNKGGSNRRGKKSEHFEVINDFMTNFTDVGGYDSIKKELEQCIDLLKNHTKYSKFNVRVPKGLIFEGPPGNGKTLLAKALAGEAKTSFIAVSGSQFQEMYVGIGSARIRELFELAQKNIPCIIFIDEIDALGRNRGSDKESSSTERDSTLNELLVALDGFKTKSGIFLIGATNRVDLLDPALVRPGRIDKRMFIGNPDEAARNAIINIHSQGKPREESIIIDDLVEITNGFSAAQIENLLNEAMLNALRENREIFTQSDLDIVYNKVLVGWQPSDHIFTDELLDKICIHEMGHAIVGLLSQHHSKVKKVVINLSSPNSPGYTIFEKSNYNIHNRESLFEHLMILLGGRIAEETFYGHAGISTGAISDFEEALELAGRMINDYGMGEMAIYPNSSEKYKELIDNEISKLLQEAYTYASIIISNSKKFIYDSAVLLKQNRVITAEELMETIETNHSEILDIHIHI